MAVVILALSVTISKIFSVEIVHDQYLDLWNESRSNANILIESPCMTLFDVNCNVCHLSHHFEAVCCQNIHYLDVAL